MYNVCDTLSSLLQSAYRFKGYSQNKDVATFGERVKLAMIRKGLSVAPEANPGAALYNLWVKAYGEHEKGHIDFITRQSPHDWLKSHKKIGVIDPHRLMRLADLLGVSSRWLLRGNHLGHVNIEPVIGMSEEEIRLLDGFRNLTPENRLRLMERLETMLEGAAPTLTTPHRQKV